jgi:hypothetical protein
MSDRREVGEGNHCGRNILEWKIRKLFNGLNIKISWDVMPCSLVDRYQRLVSSLLFGPILDEVVGLCKNLG